MKNKASDSHWGSLFGNDWSEQLDSEDDSQRHWLLSTGSLTERLKLLCQQSLHVHLLHQSRTVASDAAASCLGVGVGDELLHREVLLCDGAEALVFACSLLPVRALTGKYEALRQLDERPLGHWIFAEPALRRQSVCFAQLRSDNLIFSRLDDRELLKQTVWGRRSLFVGAAAPLLVSEFFLPRISAFATEIQ